MRLIRPFAAMLLLGVAACSTTSGDTTLFAKYQPTSAPYPYSSPYCP